MATSRSSSRRPRAPSKVPASQTSRKTVIDGLSGLAEQFGNRILKLLGLAILSRERIQEALDEAVECGRQRLDQARRIVGGSPPFPISGYDGLTAVHAERRLPGLTPPELRDMRDYERRHKNRKSVLTAIEKGLG